MLRKLIASVAGLGLLAAALGLFLHARAGRTRCPDVVMIAIDTLRADHVGCLGNDWIATPNIDALAADGVLFTRCFATAPWTLPSFASIFTGLLPSRHGAVGGAHEVLDDRFQTLAECLSDAGYRTYGFASVKWLTPPFGTCQGFNFERPVTAPEGLDGAPLVTALGTATFDLPRDKPLFTFLHYFDVHAPYTPPPPFARRYYAGDERAPGRPVLDFLLSPANAAPNRASGMYDWLAGVTDLDFPAREYAAAVTYEDDHVGRVIAKLKAAGRYDDALIVLVADHGEHLGEHDIWFTHALPYQETLHVPLLIKLPRGEGAGRVVDTPVSTLDLMPTLLGRLGLPAPAGDGRSLRALLAGEADDGVSLLAAEHGSEPNDLGLALIEWPWKSIHTRTPDGTRRELYNLELDPGEECDLQARCPRQLASMSGRVEEAFEAWRGGGPVQLAKPAAVDAATRRHLRSLGYVVGRGKAAADAEDDVAEGTAPASSSSTWPAEERPARLQ